ncbi:MAG: glutamyl-tRNA amidotransferase [Flavobacteriales bacterium]|nr:glutamyl-tRNA amidotransferase [Flavobacteriales bacterium]
MSLETRIMEDIKSAMLSKDTLRLEVCRSIKSAILLLKTGRDSEDLTEEKEIEILQKLLKQRQDSAKIYLEQKRLDLAKHEEGQARIISSYLPTPYSHKELEELIDLLMVELNINSMKDMGRLIASAISRAKGRSDGKTISTIVKKKLTPPS